MRCHVAQHGWSVKERQRDSLPALVAASHRLCKLLRNEGTVQQKEVRCGGLSNMLGGAAAQVRRLAPRGPVNHQQAVPRHGPSATPATALLSLLAACARGKRNLTMYRTPVWKSVSFTRSCPLHPQTVGWHAGRASGSPTTWASGRWAVATPRPNEVTTTPSQKTKCLCTLRESRHHTHLMAPMNSCSTRQKPRTSCGSSTCFSCPPSAHGQAGAWRCSMQYG